MHQSALSMAMPMSLTSPKGRILCVDDEPAILRALCWLLQKEFEVVAAGSAREGLEMVRRDDFDVVLSDQGMPEMSGEQFLKEVGIVAPRAMRILLADIGDLPAILHSANESRIFRYVTKPWNVSEFPAIVAQAAEIARSRLPSPKPEKDQEMGVLVSHEAGILVIDESSDIHATAEAVAGDLAPIIHVRKVGDAIQALRDGRVGVIVAEARLGSTDLTRLISLVKQKCPEIASVMLGKESGSDRVAQLIDSGQIHRFVSLPISAIELREALSSALACNRHFRAQQGWRSQPSPSSEWTVRPSPVPEGDTAAAPPAAMPPTAPGARANRLLQRLAGMALGRV